MNNALAVDPEGDQSGSPGDCSICLMKMAGCFNPTTQLDCGHTFHQKCIKECTKRGDLRCPLCRQGITGNQNITSGKTNHNGLQPLNRRCSIDSRLIYISLGVGTVGFVCALLIYTTLVYFSDEDPSLNSSLSD